MKNSSSLMSFYYPQCSVYWPECTVHEPGPLGVDALRTPSTRLSSDPITATWVSQQPIWAIALFPSPCLGRSPPWAMLSILEPVSSFCLNGMNIAGTVGLLAQVPLGERQEE